MLFQGEVGLFLSTAYSLWKGVIVPKLTLAYINQTPITTSEYRARFVNSQCVFTGRGGDYERNLFSPRFNLTYRGFQNRVNVSLYYDSQIASSYWAQDVGFDFTFRF